MGHILKELARLYNPLIDAPVVDPATSARIMTLLETGRSEEAATLLDDRYRLYAPIDDAEHHEPGAPPG